MRTTLATLFLLFAAALVAQTGNYWIHELTPYEGWDEFDSRNIMRCSDGGFAICGEVYDFDIMGSAGFIMKFDSTGAEQWLSYDSTTGGESAITSFVETDDGGFISYNESQRRITKRDSEGHEQWSISEADGGYMGEISSMDMMPDGNIVFAGCDFLNNGYNAATLQIINQEGTVLWGHSYVFAGDDWGWFDSVRATADGGIVAGGGGRYQSTRAYKGRILRLNSECDSLFSRLTSIDWGINTSIAISPSNHIAFCFAQGGGGIAMFDSLGTLLWNHYYDHANGEGQFSVVALPDNSFTVWEHSSGGMLYNTTIADSIRWRSGFGSDIYVADYSNDKCLALLPDGGYAVVGFNAIAKLDSLGQVDGVSIDEETIPPANGMLLAIGPNPFNGPVGVSCGLAEANRSYRLQVFNLRGQLVRELRHEQNSNIMHTVTWDTRDSHGALVPSGVYLFRLAQGSHQIVKKAMYIK
jgi:hypothetical protein